MAPRAIAFGGLVGLIAATGGVSLARPAVRIDSVSVEAEVTGGVARSKVTYVLRNHSTEEGEGDFELELPEGAALLRLAMDTRPGKMMDGEIEKPEKARRIYEQIVASKRDPALIEHVAGDRYRLRAFPIPPRGRKTVLLVFDHRVPWVGGERRYELRLPASAGRPSRVRRVRATIRVGGRVRARSSRSNSAEPVAVAWRPGRDAPVVTARIHDETWFSAELLLPGRARSGWRHLVAAVDTSSSIRAIDHQRVRGILARLIRETPTGGSIDIIAGSTRRAQCRGSRALACLDRAPRGGATDLGGLLGEATDRAAELGDGTALVIFSDGVASVGLRSAEVLGKALAARLEHTGVEVLAVKLGDDTTPIAELAAAAGWKVVEPSPRRVARTLSPIALTDLQVAEPFMLSDRQAPAGAAVAITGKLPEGRERGDIEVTGWYRGRQRRWRVRLERDAPRSPAVEGVWVRAKLSAMAAAGASDDELLAFAKTHGVAGVGSSMIVLETEAAYKRWAIARTQGPLQRRRAPVPVIRCGCGIRATGDIDKNIIRRVIRARRRQIRHCYNRALMRRPGLEGTITAKLIVRSWTGELAAARIASSSLGDAPMEACVAKQLEGLRFPRARGGGLVVVRYPFQFHRPETTRVEKAIARRERIREIEAGEVSARRAQEIGELIALYAADRDFAAAARALRLLERQLRAAGRSDAELLAALPTRALRRRFAATFRRAARARLGQPSPPSSLFSELFDSALRDEPGAIAADFERFRPDASEAARSIERLLEAGHRALAARLFRTFRAAGRYTAAELYRIASRDGFAGAMPDLLFEAAAQLATRETFDDLITTARTAARRRRAGAIVRARCTSLEDTDDPCLGWLDKLVRDPRTRRHRAALLRKLLAENDRDRDRSDRWSEVARAEILERLGRLAEALATVEEQLEANPDDGEVRALYHRLRDAASLRKK